jgi:hypothetical protein
MAEEVQIEAPEQAPSEPQIVRMVVLSDESNTDDLENLEELLRKALEELRPKRKAIQTTFVLDSSKDEWFYSPVDKGMIRLPGGMPLLVSDDTPNDEGKLLCYCELGFILVPSERIIPLGCN